MSVAVAESIAPGVDAVAPPTLDAVYRAHAAQVARWVRHLGGPALDVEDGVHEVFMVVTRRLPEFRGDAKLTTWLYRITERVVRDARRKERVRSFLRRRQRADIEAATHSAPGTPGESLERERAIATVHAILDTLPEKYRRVLVLFELEGLPGEEIATLTGIKLATVWVHLHRARSQFLDEMKRRERRAS